MYVTYVLQLLNKERSDIKGKKFKNVQNGQMSDFFYIFIILLRTYE